MTLKIGRAKYHSTTLKSNQGTGKVVSSVGFMGRGIVLRKALVRRSFCPTGGNCYTSKQMNPKNN